MTHTVARRFQVEYETLSYILTYLSMACLIPKWLKLYLSLSDFHEITDGLYWSLVVLQLFQFTTLKMFFFLNLKPELENTEKELIFRRRQQSIPKVQMKETACYIYKLELLNIRAKGSNLTKPPHGHKGTQPYIPEQFLHIYSFSFLTSDFFKKHCRSLGENIIHLIILYS